jgi:type II restriction enzyme
MTLNEMNLAQHVIDEFAPRFAPNSEVIYIGDDDKGGAYLNRQLLAGLGVTMNAPEGMPDVILYSAEKGWLYVIDLITVKRVVGIERLFSGAKAGQVYVIAVKTRREMERHLPAITWGTHVWVSEEEGAFDTFLEFIIYLS